VRLGVDQVQLAALAAQADVQLRVIEGQEPFTAVGDPVPIGHRQGDAGLRCELRLGVLAMPQRLATFQLHPTGQSTQQHTEQGQHPQHQQQRRPALPPHSPDAPLARFKRKAIT